MAIVDQVVELRSELVETPSTAVNIMDHGHTHYMPRAWHDEVERNEARTRAAIAAAAHTQAIGGDQAGQVIISFTKH